METCSYSPILIHWVTLSTVLFTMLFLIYHRELPGSMLQLWYFTTYMYYNLFNQSSTYGHSGFFFIFAKQICNENASIDVILLPCRIHKRINSCLPAMNSTVCVRAC